MTPAKPRVLLCASSASGHIMHMIKIAEQLVLRGHECVFLAIDEFQRSIERIGATFRHIDGVDVNSLREDWYPEGWSPASLAVSFLKVIAVAPMAHQMERLYTTLAEMMQCPDDAGLSTSSRGEIVVLTETMFVGAAPMYYGAPLPPGFRTRPNIINIHALSYTIGSADLPPFGLGLMPATTQEERANHQALLQSLVDGPFKEINDLFHQEVIRLGGVEYQRAPKVLPWETLTVSNDICLQLTPSSLEYPISDRHSKIKLIGTLPRDGSKTFTFPSFWDEVTSREKKLVVVTQGTIEQNYRNLVIPTLHALEDSSDMLVVAVLGRKGANLGNFKIPDNARVVDYLSYDAILPYASVFVFNAGYGGLIHGVVNRVPMVFAGETEEKPDVANRGEYAGVGINLKTGQPSAQQIQSAVSQVLDDPRYKQRVVEVMEENEKLCAMDTIERTIQDFSRN